MYTPFIYTPEYNSSCRKYRTHPKWVERKGLSTPLRVSSSHTPLFTHPFPFSRCQTENNSQARLTSLREARERLNGPLARVVEENSQSLLESVEKFSKAFADSPHEHLERRGRANNNSGGGGGGGNGSSNGSSGANRDGRGVDVSGDHQGAEGARERRCAPFKFLRGSSLSGIIRRLLYVRRWTWAFFTTLFCFPKNWNMTHLIKRLELRHLYMTKNKQSLLLILKKNLRHTCAEKCVNTNVFMILVNMWKKFEKMRKSSWSQAYLVWLPAVGWEIVHNDSPPPAVGWLICVPQTCLFPSFEENEGNKAGFHCIFRYVIHQTVFLRIVVRTVELMNLFISFVASCRLTTYVHALELFFALFGCAVPCCYSVLSRMLPTKSFFCSIPNHLRYAGSLYCAMGDSIASPPPLRPPHSFVYISSFCAAFCYNQNSR